MGEPRLDPKYLPHQPEMLAHRMTAMDLPSSVTPGVVRPTAVERGGRGGGRGGRGGRGSGGRGNVEQVPLLSAYFPNT